MGDLRGFLTINNRRKVMDKYDGWVFKNKWGSLLMWTFGSTKRECRKKVSDWKQWERVGHKPVKVKLMEVK